VPVGTASIDTPSCPRREVAGSSRGKTAGLFSRGVKRRLEQSESPPRRRARVLSPEPRSPVGSISSVEDGE